MELANLLADLNNFVTNFHYQVDTCRDNFMERGNVTLVVSDPVFDRDLSRLT
jgi:hypothetical protein